MSKGETLCRRRGRRAPTPRKKLGVIARKRILIFAAF